MASWDVTTAGSAIEFDTVNGTQGSSCLIDDAHFVLFYQGADSDGFAQVFTVNTSTWAVSTSSSAIEFDTAFSVRNKSVAIDSNHFLNIWINASSNMVAQVFTVNTSTWAVSTAASGTTIATLSSTEHSSLPMDANHVLVLRKAGLANIIEVNTSTWSVSTTIDDVDVSGIDTRETAQAKIDDTHALAVYGDASGNGYAQVLAVNTSTWAVSTTAGELNYITASGKQPLLLMIDSTHCFLASQNSSLYAGFAQVLEVNTSTWAVSTTATPLQFVPDFEYGYPQAAMLLDDNHLLFIFSGDSSDGYAQVLEVNTSTWVVSTSSSAIEFDTVNLAALSGTLLDLGNGYFCVTWAGSGNDGYAQVLFVEIPGGGGPSFLSAWARNSNSILKVM